MACGTGALPEGPFCGGRCGACPQLRADSPPGCVGVSEGRGYGVCAPHPYRCSPASASGGYRDCGLGLAYLGATTEARCACMVIEPAYREDLVDQGWPVAVQSCLAYREQFPGQIRCMDETWTEL